MVRYRRVTQRAHHLLVRVRRGLALEVTHEHVLQSIWMEVYNLIDVTIVRLVFLGTLVFVCVFIFSDFVCSHTQKPGKAQTRCEDLLTFNKHLEI